MKRNEELVKKRQDFVVNYIKKSVGKQMKVIIIELTEILFLSEKTIWNIWRDYRNQNRKKR